MTDQQALEAIERICGDDFCGDMSMRWKEPLDPTLKTAMDKIHTVYRIAHSFVKLHECYDSHDNWRAEAGEFLPANKENT